MGLTHSSPGVYTQERDFSARAQAAPTSIGVVVGEADRGPVGQRVLVTSDSEYVSVFGNPNAKIGFMGHSAVAFLGEAKRLYVTRVAPEALFGGCIIGWDGTYNMSRPFSGGMSEPELISFATGDLFSIYAINPGDWNADLYVRLIPNTKIPGSYFFLEVYYGKDAIPVEKWNCHLNYVVDGTGVQLNVAQQINKKSKFIRIVQNEDQPDFVASPNFAFINTFDAGGNSAKLGITFVGGANGRRPTLGELIQAWDLYEDPEEIDINILINAGYTQPEFQTRMDELCRDRMDCVAILDTPSDMQGVQDALAFRRTYLHLDSSYSALYSPDVLIADKYNDVRLYVPPSGFVAAAYARTDRDFESWFAPAGMVRGDLKVAGIREVYDQGKRDALYESQVNAIRVIEGEGIKIWGADTLQIMPSSLSNMSVRRLMIFIEKSMGSVLLYSVFDPNDQVLRTRLEDMGRRFLKQLTDARALYSAEVVCDETNNTPDIIAAGDLIYDFWLDAVLPAKRVHFTATINKTGVRVTGGNI